MIIERPLDFLNSLKGETILLYAKNNLKPVKVKLLAFDIHINLVVETPDGRKDFYRGENVDHVSEE
jgi:small nuclear ribonucleoprotein (snRNP)-like protein